MSGLPKPRSMTSCPARRSSVFSASTAANAYGGTAPIRRNSRLDGIVRHPPPRRRTASALHARPVLALLLGTVPGGADGRIPASEHAQDGLAAGVVLPGALPLLGGRRAQVATVPELDRV